MPAGIMLTEEGGLVPDYVNWVGKTRPLWTVPFPGLNLGLGK